MAHSFELTKKAKFDFEFIIDGEKVVESIFVNMSDRDLPKRLLAINDAIDKRSKEYELKDVKMKSDGIPTELKTIEDVEKLSSEQIEDIVNLSSAMYDITESVEKSMIEEISNALGTDVSNCFKYLKPFDVWNGKYFAQAFMEALSQDIIAYANAHPVETVQVSEKPYMKKYMKKLKR